MDKAEMLKYINEELSEHADVCIDEYEANIVGDIWGVDLFDHKLDKDICDIWSL